MARKNYLYSILLILICFLVYGTFITFSNSIPIGNQIEEWFNTKTIGIKSNNKIISNNLSGAIFYNTAEDTTLSQISASHGIIVEDDIRFYASAIDVFLTDEQYNDMKSSESDWNIKMVNAGQQVNEGDNAVKIAILDSGIDYCSSVRLSGSINLVEEECDLPAYMNDMTGHGTAVASILRKIDNNAEIYSVRVLNADDYTDLNTVIKGLQWCVDNEIDIINISFGTKQKSAILENMLNDIRNKGIIVVAAGGNNYANEIDYPAKFESTISVGSVNCRGEITDFSSKGAGIDLYAPGENVPCESMFGMHSWQDGSSLATPHVTGLVSRLLHIGNKRDKSSIDTVLKATSKNVKEARIIDVEAAETACRKEKEYNIKKNNENESHITFDEEDIFFNASWTCPWHINAVTNGYNNLESEYGEGFMSNVALTVMKRGAIYSDYAQNADGSKTFVIYWHGLHKSANHSTLNYIAEYRFITKMAAYSGDTSSFTTGVVGLSSGAYSAMKGKVSTTSIGGKTWKVAIDTMPSSLNATSGQALYGTSYYTDGSSNNRKKKLRRCFLYGMAIHAAMDTFSHASYKRINGQYIHLMDTAYEDDPTYCPDRYEDARAAAQRTIKAYMDIPSNPHTGQEGSIGGIGTFSPAMSNRGAAEDYYLARPIQYAHACTNDNTNWGTYDSWFQYINYND